MLFSIKSCNTVGNCEKRKFYVRELSREDCYNFRSSNTKIFSVIQLAHHSTITYILIPLKFSKFCQRIVSLPFGCSSKYQNLRLKALKAFVTSVSYNLRNTSQENSFGDIVNSKLAKAKCLLSNCPAKSVKKLRMNYLPVFVTTIFKVALYRDYNARRWSVTIRRCNNFFISKEIDEISFPSCFLITLSG